MVYTILILLTVLVPALSRPAYLDPGSGAIIIQVIVASLLGAVFIFRNTLARLFGFKGKTDSQPPEDPPVPGQPDDDPRS
jgi:hypothetical protein